MALHVVVDAVYHDIISGGIDVLELLRCCDMRFFAEIVSDAGLLERRLFQMMPDTPLNEIKRQLQLSPEHWTVEVTPPRSLEAPATSSLRASSRNVADQARRNWPVGEQRAKCGLPKVS